MFEAHYIPRLRIPSIHKFGGPSYRRKGNSVWPTIEMQSANMHKELRIAIITVCIPIGGCQQQIRSWLQRL